MGETKTNTFVEADILLNVHSRSLLDHPALKENFIPLSQDAQADLLAEHSPKHKLLAEVKVLQQQLEEKRIKLVRAKNEFHAAENSLAERYHIQEMYQHIEDMEQFYHGFRGKLDELCGQFDHHHPEVDAMLHWFNGIENMLHALGTSKLSEKHIHPKWTLENIKKLVEHDTFSVLEAHQEHAGKFAGVSTALDRLIKELAGNEELQDLHKEAQMLKNILDTRKKEETPSQSIEKNSSLPKELAIQAGGITPESRIKKLLELQKKKQSGFSGESSPHAHIHTETTYN
jgi:hypothetical protein